MHRIECVEEILQATNIFASFMVVEIKKHKGWQSVVFGTEKAELNVACHDIQRKLISENVEDKDEGNAKTVVVRMDLLGYKDSKCKHKAGRDIG